MICIYNYTCICVCVYIYIYIYIYHVDPLAEILGNTDAQMIDGWIGARSDIE